jgi:NSS family neurotransmitter:Na+ symporter
MPGGRVFASFFFLFVLFAAWTSSISLLEPFVAWLTERYGVHRKVAAWGTGGVVWLLGVAVCLSLNEWKGFQIFDRNLFDVLDHSSSRILMPLSGLGIAIYVGWVMKRAFVRDEMRQDLRWLTPWFNVLRYVVPVGLILVFLGMIGLVTMVA